MIRLQRSALFGVLLVACAPRAAPRAGPTAPKASPPPADAGPTRAADPGADVPTVEVLAARGDAEIAKMHEFARVPEAAAHPVEFEPAPVDVCFRAIIAANTDVVARFEDDGHVARGESGTAGLVPPRGPACARKGERLRLVVERAASDMAGTRSTVARAVIWRAP